MNSIWFDVLARCLMFSMLAIAGEAEENPELLKEAPTSRPVRRLDEVSRIPLGFPHDFIEEATEFVYGEAAAVTDVVPRLTGHPARTVAGHLRAHPEDWAHLRS